MALLTTHILDLKEYIQNSLDILDRIPNTNETSLKLKNVLEKDYTNICELYDNIDVTLKQIYNETSEELEKNLKDTQDTSHFTSSTSSMTKTLYITSIYAETFAIGTRYIFIEKHKPTDKMKENRELNLEALKNRINDLRNAAHKLLEYDLIDKELLPDIMELYKTENIEWLDEKEKLNIEDLLKVYNI